jgi:hypothetical protein
MATISIKDDSMESVMQQLAIAAASGNNTVGISVCTAVAVLIVGSGRHGGSEQQAMMDLASRYGFRPSYYADSVRVMFEKEPS